MKQKVDYRCSVCYKTKIEVIEWGEGRCPESVCECGGKMTWFRISSITEPQGNRCYVDELMRDNPRFSEAMGINPDQIPEFRKIYPDSTYDSEGRLLIRNRADKLKKMKERGYTYEK